MRKLFKLGLLVCVLALGMMVIGCDPNTGGTGGTGGTDPALNGNWSMNGVTNLQILKLNNGSWEFEGDGSVLSKGTYSTDGNSITLTLTQAAMGGGELLTKSQLLEQYPEMTEQINAGFEPQTSTYAISGNTLTLDDGDLGGTYTKQ